MENADTFGFKWEIGGRLPVAVDNFQPTTTADVPTCPLGRIWDSSVGTDLLGHRIGVV